MYGYDPTDGDVQKSVKQLEKMFKIINISQE